MEEELANIDREVEAGDTDETKEVRRMALPCLVEKCYERKDCYYKQMSRSKLAKDMDRNSRYFHAITGAKDRKKVF